MRLFGLFSKLGADFGVNQIENIIEAAFHIFGTADADLAIGIVLTIVPRSNVMRAVLWGIKRAWMWNILGVVRLPKEIVRLSSVFSCVFGRWFRCCIFCSCFGCIFSCCPGCSCVFCSWLLGCWFFSRNGLGIDRFRWLRVTWFWRFTVTWLRSRSVAWFWCGWLVIWSQLSGQIILRVK